MNKIKCPACEGYETFSAKGSILNHIRTRAKSEALSHYLGLKTTTKHADFIKGNMEVVQKEKITFKF